MPTPCAAAASSTAGTMRSVFTPWLSRRTSLSFRPHHESTLTTPAAASEANCAWSVALSRDEYKTRAG